MVRTVPGALTAGFCPMIVAFILAVSAATSVAQDTQDPAKEDGWRVVTDSDREMLARIDEGIRSWRDNLEFYGTYKYSQGVTTSMEDAMQGRFVKLAADPSGDESSTGDLAESVQVKLGNAFRFSLIVDQPQVIDENGGSSWNSEEIFLANDITLRHSPIHRTPKLIHGGTVHFMKMSDRRSNMLFRATSMVSMSPFVLCGGNDGELFAPVLNKGVIAIRVVTLSKETVEIGLQTETRTPVIFRIRTVGQYPVVEQVRNGNRVVYLASEFVDCGNGCLFPGRAVRAQGPYQTDDTGRDFWISRVWASSDLGERRPGPDDFAFEIPPDTDVYGLGPVRQGDKIDVLTLTVGDLETSSKGSDLPERQDK